LDKVQSVNVSENHIGDNLDFSVDAPDNPRKLQKYEYHPVDHKKPFQAVPHLITCVTQFVHYEQTFDLLILFLLRNDGSGNESPR
jgi:hypothetical protein